MDVTVVIVTADRPAELRRALEALRDQEPAAVRIVVVDSSRSSERGAPDLGPDVIYVRNTRGYGNLGQARNLGVERSVGEVVAFLDDDAFPRPGWLAALLEPFIDPEVGGGCGRAINPQPGPAVEPSEVGRLDASGRTLGNFHADLAAAISVDHLLGCNMAFRRELLLRLGGFNEVLTGPVRDDTDISLRIRRLGYRLEFVPGAVVDHVGAPQPRGRRFGIRYTYYSTRNQLAVLTANMGVSAPVVPRFIGATLRESMAGLWTARPGTAARAAVQLAALPGGYLRGVQMRRASGGRPERSGRAADVLRASMRGGGSPSGGIEAPAGSQL